MLNPCGGGAVLEIVQVPHGVPGDEGQRVGGRHDHQCKYCDHHRVLVSAILGVVVLKIVLCPQLVPDDHAQAVGRRHYHQDNQAKNHYEILSAMSLASSLDLEECFETMVYAFSRPAQICSCIGQGHH